MSDDKLVLIIPSKEMKEEILQYKEEHFKSGDMQVHGSGGILVKEFTEDGMVKQHYHFELNCL